MARETLLQKRTIIVTTALLFVIAACTAPPDFQNIQETRPVGITKQLEVKLSYDVGTLEVLADSGTDLFSFDLDYDANRSTPHFDFREGERATLDFSMNHRLGFNNVKRGNALTLRLNDKVPMDMDFTAGVSDSHLDLTDLDITRFHLRGGVGRTDVSFDHPLEQPMSYFEVASGVGSLAIRGLGNTAVQRLKVDGGVGRTDLDFTGDLKDRRIDTEINVGVGQVRLLFPRDVGITIEAQESPLSHISAPGFDKDRQTYTHRGTDGSIRISVRVRSGVGGISVELV